MDGRASEGRDLQVASLSSDLTNEKGASWSPSLPTARHEGRARHVKVREVLSSIFYALAAGQTDGRDDPVPGGRLRQESAA